MSKQYKIGHNVGNAKYLISYHDGVKTHKDGSPFFDIAIFRNKKKMADFLQILHQLGYFKA